MMLAQSIVVALVAALAAASPCPFGQMAERGELSAEQTAQFYKARSEKEAGVEAIMMEQRKRELDHQASAYEMMQKRGLLPLGGGLLNGQLQPFTGALSQLAVPTPQEFGLAIIPDAEHPYVAPLPTDVRGMCPTLNTMANHGYISHDGITTFAQAADACQITLGFGYDTCVFLSALGLLAGGDLPSGIYSIGGADSRVPNSIGPALGASKHGFFEIDDSINRQDTFFGNQANFNLSRWERWNAIAQSNGDSFGFTTMNQERQISFAESKTQNPQFNSDAKALAVALAERVFIPRALPNGTHESQADFQNISPFYLDETFPDMWFRRATPYGLQDVGVDIVTLYAMGPTPIGINDGYDNFIPDNFDFAALTPAEATCFLLTSALDFVPGQLTPAFTDATDVYMAFAYGAIATFGAANSCGMITYTAPGPDAGSTTPGVSTTHNILINGTYH